MHPFYCGVKYYSPNDLSICTNFEKAKTIMETISFTKECPINGLFFSFEVIQTFYDISKYLYSNQPRISCNDSTSRIT